MEEHNQLHLKILNRTFRGWLTPSLSRAVFDGCHSWSQCCPTQMGVTVGMELMGTSLKEI